MGVVSEMQHGSLNTLNLPILLSCHVDQKSSSFLKYWSYLTHWTGRLHCSLDASDLSRLLKWTLTPDWLQHGSIVCHRSKGHCWYFLLIHYLLTSGVGVTILPWVASWTRDCFRQHYLVGFLWNSKLISLLFCFSTMRPPVEVCVFLLSLLAPGVLYTMNNIPALQE